MNSNKYVLMFLVSTESNILRNGPMDQV